MLVVVVGVVVMAVVVVVTRAKGRYSDLRITA